jgi:predicted glycoside hydrolase/deacetylase ChbG (UPF0249 family)
MLTVSGIQKVPVPAIIEHAQVEECAPGVQLTDLSCEEGRACRHPSRFARWHLFHTVLSKEYRKGERVRTILLLVRCAVMGSWILGIVAFSQSAASSDHQVLSRQDSPAKPEAHYLLIEAQDLGMAHSIDKASFEALEKGWVTSAGVLDPAPWFPELVRWARAHSDADLSLQLDLNAEWATFRWRPAAPALPNSGLSDPAGYLPNNARYIAQHAKPEEVAAEFRAQVATARQADLVVTHVDSHGGIVFLTPWLFNEYWKTAKDAGLPAVLSKEYVAQRGKPTGKPGIYDVAGIEIDIANLPIDRIIEMQPGFEAKDWLSAYERTLAALPPGTYLLQVHLGFADDELKAMTEEHPNWGAQWRQNDYDVVSSAEFQKFLKDQGFQLVRWRDLAKQAAATQQPATANRN